MSGITKAKQSDLKGQVGWDWTTWSSGCHPLAEAWNKMVFKVHPKPFCGSMICQSLDNVLATLHCQGLFAVGLGEFGRFDGGEQPSLLWMVAVPWGHQFFKA